MSDDQDKKIDAPGGPILAALGGLVVALAEP